MDTQKLIMQTIDAFNRHDADAFVDAYATDANCYDPMYENPLVGHDAIRKDIVEFFDAFPDVHSKFINPVLINGNMAAFEVEITGTHKGSLVSPSGDIPPTNKRMSFKVAQFIEVSATGKIQTNQRYYDMMGIMSQLGLMQENA